MSFLWKKEEPSTYRVLMVSDDPTTASLVSDMLTENGHTVHVYPTTADAVKRVDDAGLPNVLIGDFANPTVDGKDFLVSLRYRFGASALPPVVFLMDAKDDEIAAQSLDVQDVLAKPVDCAALLMCIEKLVVDAQPKDEKPKS